MTTLVERRHDPELPIPPRNRQEIPCLAEGDGYLCSAPVGHDGPHVAYGSAELPFRVWTPDAYRRPFAEALDAAEAAS